MYVIITYDVDVARVQRVCDYLRTYLPRVQNSVFEGEITESRFERLKAGLLKKIEPDTDSILLWVLRDAKWVDRQTLGPERNPISRIL
jgi:CRISPR-associated protein Cas2